ncbi:TPA: hypothetical protein ACH3X3_001001 [Trebouxia sp. C0006]
MTVVAALESKHASSSSAQAVIQGKDVSADVREEVNQLTQNCISQHLQSVGSQSGQNSMTQAHHLGSKSDHDTALHSDYPSQNALRQYWYLVHASSIHSPGWCIIIIELRTA